jgi:hypothetical protein
MQRWRPLLGSIAEEKKTRRLRSRDSPLAAGKKKNRASSEKEVKTKEGGSSGVRLPDGALFQIS